jgi:hypothetical protein
MACLAATMRAASICRLSRPFPCWSRSKLCHWRYPSVPTLVLGGCDPKSFRQFLLLFLGLCLLHLLASPIGVSFQPLFLRVALPLGAMPCTRGEGASDKVRVTNLLALGVVGCFPSATGAALCPLATTLHGAPVVEPATLSSTPDGRGSTAIASLSTSCWSSCWTAPVLMLRGFCRSPFDPICAPVVGRLLPATPPGVPGWSSQSTELHRFARAKSQSDLFAHFMVLT